jgi:hypothetical protein
MVFKATFNNISAISCRSVLLVKETGVAEENTNLKVALNTINQHKSAVEVSCRLTKIPLLTILLHACLFLHLLGAKFIATFNNISAISCRSVLLVKETGVAEENTNLSQGTDKHYHITFSQ